MPEMINGLTLEAKVENLNQALAFIDDQLDAVDCPMKKRFQIDVAVEELFVNVAHYAYTPNTGNVTLRVEGSMGDSENRSASDNEVYLHRVKNQAGEDSTYFTARYNTTPSDNSG